jgi:uncharacterized cupredoxin-like copper-binding protein
MIHMRSQANASAIFRREEQSMQKFRTTVVLGAVLASTALMPPAARAGDVQTVNVKASETANGMYAFSGLPSALKGGVVKFVLTNTGKEPHDLQLIRYDGTHTPAEVAKIIASDGAPIPSWMHANGGVGSVGPGGVGSATMNLGAGKYIVLCTFQNDTTKKYHSMAGMTGMFTVTGAKQGQGFPAGATATVTASEYGFVTEGLKVGKNLVEFKDTGKEIHHFQLFPVLPGKTFADVKAALASQAPPTGPPPFDPTHIQGSGAIEKSEGSLLMELTLAKGSYAMLCFVNDRAGGPPHFMKGMIIEVVIK